MTVSEWSFLALGLALGLVGGAALIEILRARPPSPRVVRVTVAHEAIPRRSLTLADDAFAAVRPEPAQGGPADRRNGPGLPVMAGLDRRTNVRSAAGQTAGPGAVRPAAPPVATATRVMTARTVASGPPLGHDRVTSRAAASTNGHAGPTADARPAERAGALTAVALLDPPSGGGGSQPAAVERCVEQRRLADERCELATRARTQADGAAGSLRAAQRRYDEHEAAAVTASWRADPRAIHQAKDAAQGGFRTAVAAAATPEALEDAARDWLNEINRINTDARDATATAEREHAAAAEIGANLDRLGLEADAARIAAETADAACLTARATLADCEEARTTDAVNAVPTPTPVPTRPRLDEDEALTTALDSGEAPVIFRILRGDRQAMTALVASLAGADTDARRQWQMLMTGLVDAIVANAIEAASLEFPADHPFWGLFTKEQNRDIAHALSSLGYRFDGLGGWTDERLPSQRDLSLALGYAGLDPMRIRQWPDAEDTGRLFADVAVAADEYLVGVAGDLTLVEMVTMLGRRADGLAGVWNDWGRIRPLLLAEG